MIRITSDYDPIVTPPPAPAVHGEGPVMTDDRYEQVLAKLAANEDLKGENIQLPAGAGAVLSRGLLAVGIVLLALTVFGAFVHTPAHALASFEVGVFTVLACCLGSLFFVMLFQALNAYWPVTIRRQMENAAGLIWLPLLGMAVVVLIELVSSVTTGHGILFHWLDESRRGTHLIEHKGGYLNIGFLLFRFVVYAALWLYLARSMVSMSREQDATGDRMLTSAMRRRGTWGLLAFALTVAFSGFDFLMSLDYRFFSTMWGVYIFAGAALSGVALCAVVCSVLRLTGRLTNVVTDEHFHDLGKLLFAFGACFWAYIAFSQYFLIWYGNLPEETAYFIFRKSGGWEHVSMLLVVAHFIVPFFLLISRSVKRNTLLLGLLGVYVLGTQVLDMIWIIRPMADVNGAAVSPVSWWLDVVAIGGVLAVFAGLLIRTIVAAPLIPMKDPRLQKCLEHKNYV